MSIDFSQFYQTFFEESLESLEEIEQILLNLSEDSVDDETINTIFRAAHSIKGSSGTFGFNDISEFTHILETYLDLVRDGEKQLTADSIDLLLQSVDCIRAMIDCLQQNTEIDLTEAKNLGEQFQALIDGKELPKAEPTAPKPAAAESKPADEEEDLDALFDQLAMAE